MSKVIGILLDHRKWRGIPKRQTGHENIGFYNRAARKLRVWPFYFSLNNMRLTTNTAKGYLYRNEHYHLTSLPIPPVIHNRSMSSAKVNRIRLQRLATLSHVFNLRTRYSKYYIHRLLEKKEKLRRLLPKTKRFSQSNLESMTCRYDALFVKPVSSSIGQGIIRLEKKGGDRWLIQTGRKVKETSQNLLYSDLLQRIGRQAYLIQEAIPLARYHGKPFDIRVSVQKNGSGKWQVTGMVGKVAAKGSHVTNVARGGRVKRCDVLLSGCGLDVKQTTRELERASLKLAKHLGKKLRNLADIGLDMGIDGKGNPYFIEMNGRDLRYSFRNGNMMKQWYRTYENPLRYGKYLLGKQGR